MATPPLALTLGIVCAKMAYATVRSHVLGSFSTEAMCIAVATEQRHAPNVHAITEVSTREGNFAMVIVVGVVVHAI